MNIINELLASERYKRILAGMGANAFGNAVTIGLQLASLPIFLFYWDISRYGTWLMLSAIPSYLTMADIGMVTVAANKMTIAMGRGDRIAANRIFQSALIFVITSSIFLVFVSSVCLYFSSLAIASMLDYKETLLALIFCVLLSFISGLADAIFRSTHRYATGIVMNSFIRIAEWLGGVLGLLWNGEFHNVAVGMLIARLIGMVLVIRYSNLDEGNAFNWGVSKASMLEMRSMLKPSVAFMMFPFTNALSFQGITLVVGLLMGSANVAIFNTYRTIARVAVQASATFSFAIWAEFSREFGRNNMNGIKQFYVRSFKIGAIIAVLVSLLLLFFSPLLLRVWSHGQIPFNSKLITILLIYAAIAGFWHVPRTLILSINKHNKLALWSVVISILTLLGAWVLGSAFDMYGVAYAMIVGELIIATASVLNANSIIYKLSEN